MTGVEDFVSRRTTVPFFMRSQPQTHGIRPNTTVALVDITGLPLKREGRYSRTTATGRGNLCTLVSVDGADIHLEVYVGTFSGSETQRQQMPTRTLEIMRSIKYNTPVIKRTLLALFALKIELPDLFCTVTNFVTVLCGSSYNVYERCSNDD